MFRRIKPTHYNCKPDQPDPLLARKIQELIGGQWGEMSVMNGYLFQGWNCRGPAKYRDMLLDIATEEIGHVEMLATMVCYLLEGASTGDQQAAAAGSSVVAGMLGGSGPKDILLASAMSPQHAIAGGLGALPADSEGNRWTAAYIMASGNLLADFRFNVAAESQGRLQAARIYNMTTDNGVRDMLSFLLARDTMHQNQWLAAIEELKADGLEDTPCPSNFPQEREYRPVSYQFQNFSEGTESSQGRWAKGASIDGKGQFTYEADPKPLGTIPKLGIVDPMVYGTPPMPMPPGANKATAL